jgi:hypothetical protein
VSVRIAALIALAERLKGVETPVAHALIAVVESNNWDANKKLTHHRLELMLDELELGVVSEDVWSALLESHLVVERDGTLIVDPQQLLDVEMDYGSVTHVAVADLIELLSDARGVSSDVHQFVPQRISAAINRVTDWASELLAFARRENRPGFPVFWNRDDDRTVPLSDDIGSMAATDTVMLALEPVRYGWPPREVNREDIHRAQQQLLGLGVDRPGDWYDGAIQLQQYDDDFVGSFVPQLASRGSCPTTEAVANRVTGLLVLGQATVEGDSLTNASAEAVEAGVHCILRWQLPSGGWGNHLYPGNENQPVARDVSTQYAAEALVGAIQSSQSSNHLRAEASESLKRLVEFLLGTALMDGDECFWDGDFAVPEDEQRLRTTTLVTMVLGRVGAIIGDARLAPIQAGAITYILRRWSPQSDGVFESTFRSPTWEGPALTEFTWDMARDAFVVCAALDWAARGGTFDPESEEKLVAAITGIVDAEYAGSWLDIPMAREGKRRAFVSNSLHNVRALLAASSWLVRSFPSGIHVP